ncbi:CHAT domain-containing protein [Chloroflexi bacterium TSY]|nr:CHAT domain-containing protein [Chloroflexi bacterium TSY]
MMPLSADEVADWQMGYLAADQLQHVGERLFNSLFSGQVGECLRGSLAQIGNDDGLRLNLRLHQTPELMALPWELLYDTLHQRFLALSEQTPINRYLALPLAQEELAAKPPLHILAVLSAPVEDEPTLDVEEEWHRLQTALAPLTERGLVSLERVEKATWSNLQRYLSQTPVHILHFVGHGFYNDMDENGGLIFEDEDGNIQQVSAQQLAHLLHNHDPLRLAVLNACEGAVASAQNLFAGVAQSLVQQGLPAVIAMQREITHQAAITLEKAFYAAIAAGYPVDAGLTQARLAIYGENETEWATPALFMRAQDGKLFELTKTDDKTASSEHLLQPVPTRLPMVENVVGRTKEVAHYLEQLESENFTVISGMPGVGKTTVAALIAQKMAVHRPVFWHSFIEGQQIDALIWELAEFLALHGQEELWHILKNQSNRSDNPPPPEVLFDNLLQLLANQRCLICLDDFQHVSAFLTSSFT